MTTNAPESPTPSTPPSEPRFWLSLLDEAVLAGLPLSTNTAYQALKCALASGFGTTKSVLAPSVPNAYKLPLRQERVQKYGGYWPLRVVDDSGREVDDTTIRALAVHASRSGKASSDEVVLQTLRAASPPYNPPLRQEHVEKYGGHYWRVVDANGLEVEDATIQALAVHASRQEEDSSNDAFRKVLAEWRKPGGLLDGPFA